jgi:hypothetical protein
MVVLVVFVLEDNTWSVWFVEDLVVEMYHSGLEALDIEEGICLVVVLYVVLLVDGDGRYEFTVSR